MDLVSQNLLLTSGGGKKTTYIDDVFSTYLFKGNATARSINNGIDLSSKGGMVWIKNRDGSFNHTLFDTERGTAKIIRSSADGAETSGSQTLTAFNNNGFSLGTDSMVNSNNDDTCSWSFRKQKGFFDIVTWTGNATANRQISHNLGCVPGCILIKQISGAAEDWAVYQRGIGSTKALKLNKTNSEDTGIEYFQNTDPTATNFTIGVQPPVNGNGNDYIAYLFAGGASDEPGSARSVDFDGSGDYLSLASSPDLAMGTGDFTVEGWFKINSGSNYAFWMNGANGLGGDIGLCVWYYYGSSYGLTFNNGSDQTTNFHPPTGQWFHLAYVRSSGTASLYYNGRLLKSASNTINYTNQTFVIGGYSSTSYLMNGSASNFRVVKGTAVYTSAFKPSTEGLAAITNTKLLCCNKNTVTGSTVTPSTITSHGNPQSSTSTPFDDPNGFKFGEEGDQNIVKCGSFLGNGSANGPEINLGFEPQWVLTKNASINDEWYIFDSMRGIVTGGYDPRLRPNSSGTESSGDQRLDLTATGFKITSNNGDINGSGNTIIYIAIRRPDGLVGKPAEVGTDVFTMVNGANSTTLEYVSNFPVDYALARRPATAEYWYTSARLIQRYLFYANETNAQQLSGSSNNQFMFDSNIGWSHTQAWGTDYQSWMWKRHAGFDVVTWSGDGVSGRQISHSMGKTPEMMWVKRRSNTEDWTVYHIGQNGGTNPEQYRLRLNEAYMNYTGTSYWNDTAPSSTYFTVGADGAVNDSSNTFIGMLFASVDGISKVGSYIGNGSASGPTITLGFAPRFIIIKCTSVNGTNWFVYDTLRGLTSGNDARIYLDLNNGQTTTADDVDPTATGFQIVTTWDQLNGNNANYIYYAHA